MVAYFYIFTSLSDIIIILRSKIKEGREKRGQQFDLYEVTTFSASKLGGTTKN